MWRSLIFGSLLLLQLAHSQRFLSREGSHEVLKGQDVQLGCVVENADEYTVMWFKDSGGLNLIYAGPELMGSDDRFLLDNPNHSVWNLTIRQVEPYDSGTYICQISKEDGSLIQRQVLSVKTPPSVNISPDQNTLTMEPGDDVSLSCFSSGNPPPTVTWRKLGGRLPDGGASLENPRLYIRDIQPEDGGDYKCFADNGVGDPASASITVLVHSARENKTAISPWVEAARGYLPAAVGQTLNITCIYDANPLPTVTWIFNAFPVKLGVGGESRKRTYYSRNVLKGHTEGTLRIRNATDDDFGDYICRVSNNMGTAEATIYVSGKPAQANVSSDTTNGTGTAVFLRWTIASPAKIEEYRIKYKPVHQDTWEQREMAASESEKQGNVWKAGYLLKGLNPETDYEIQVQGRNEQGWGNLPLRHNFKFRTGKPDSSTSDSGHEAPQKETKESGGSTSSGAQRVFTGSRRVFGALLSCSFLVYLSRLLCY